MRLFRQVLLSGLNPARAVPVEVFGGDIKAFARLEPGETSPLLAFVQLIRPLDYLHNIFGEIKTAGIPDALSGS